MRGKDNNFSPLFKIMRAKNLPTWGFALQFSVFSHFLAF